MGTAHTTYLLGKTLTVAREQPAPSGEPLTAQLWLTNDLPAAWQWCVAITVLPPLETPGVADGVVSLIGVDGTTVIPSGSTVQRCAPDDRFRVQSVGGRYAMRLQFGHTHA
jgi:hypothetical protein